MLLVSPYEVNFLLELVIEVLLASREDIVSLCLCGCFRSEIGRGSGLIVNS